MINDLRKKKLKLRPVTYLSGSQGSETEIPHAYIWSPHLVPKPKGGCSRSHSSHFFFYSIVILSPLIVTVSALCICVFVVMVFFLTITRNAERKVREKGTLCIYYIEFVQVMSFCLHKLSVRLSLNLRN